MIEKFRLRALRSRHARTIRINSKAHAAASSGEGKDSGAWKRRSTGRSAMKGGAFRAARGG
jgi:hypothetical protein